MNANIQRIVCIYVLNFQSGNSGKTNQRMCLGLPELSKKKKRKKQFLVQDIHSSA
jgi:hypothetical protein